MNFEPGGYPIMALSLAIAIGVLAASVWRRSWFLWLLGFVLLVMATGAAWIYRVPRSAGAPTALVVTGAHLA
jgi:hypothetical protein